MCTRNILLLSVLLSTPGWTLAAPWPEHPRPDLERSPWVNLNGEWSFAFDPEDVGVKERWFEPGRKPLARRILVPFPWESKLSGIGDPDYRGVAWYAREVTLPNGANWSGRNPWLVIGACDWEAKVWVNGEAAGEHVGGYVPFEVDLSRFAKPGGKVNIVIRAVDRTDPQQPVGKQIDWYTRTSGIWQTVYIEPRGANYIRELRAFPDIKQGCVTYRVQTASQKPGRLKLSSLEPGADFESVSVAVGQQTGPVEAKLVVRDPQLWTPETPRLYPVVIELLDPAGVIQDRVTTYFGLREISVAKAPGGDYTYIQLNGKPIYLMGALHQSFHPGGIHQYPDDATMRSDYELCKRVGLNFLRIHIKVPVPRELYWADKLGVLIMQDMPCFIRYTPQSQTWWQQMMEASVARDFNHPAVFSWCIFNETWGIGDKGYTPDHQEWVEKMYHRTKELDPTRLVEDNSPCNYDHVITDINSWHFYINDYKAARDHINGVVEKTKPGSSFNYVAGRTQGNAPLINSEYGGIGAGSGDQDISWCFKYLTNELRLHEKICGYVYTELSDIEWEHNGLVNYDRSPKEFGYDAWYPGFGLQDINNLDFIAIDAPPVIELTPGQQLPVTVKISHFSERHATHPVLYWQTAWRQGLSDDLIASEWASQPAEWGDYRVITQPSLTIEAPKVGRVGVLRVELREGDQVLTRNYVNLHVKQTPDARQEMVNPQTVALRFAPADFADWTFSNVVPAPSGPAAAKVWGLGEGAIEYRLKLAAEIPLADIRKIEVLAELSSKAVAEKVDWSARLTPVDYPQTDVRKWPSDVRCLINGQEIGRVCLPDDPADSRGVLTHAAKFHPGSYGYPTRFEVRGELLSKALASASKDRVLRIRWEVPPGKQAGGLAVFGEQMGLYAVDPTCLVELRTPMATSLSAPPTQSAVTDSLAAHWKPVVPIALDSLHMWRYTTTAPPKEWTRPDFPDQGWQEGPAGFGTAGTPNAKVGTSWATNDIWIRTEFFLPHPVSAKAGCWRIYHDEDIQVYLNGEKVVDLPGHAGHYLHIPCDNKTFDRLRDGRNVIAVHCKQTGGGQNVDAGLYLLIPPEK